MDGHKCFSYKRFIDRGHSEEDAVLSCTELKTKCKEKYLEIFRQISDLTGMHVEIDNLNMQPIIEELT